MKKLFIISLLMLIILLSGCKAERKAEVQASPTFKSGVYTLQGIEGKMGILANGGFKVKQANKYMWHFWGTKEELSQKPFRVEAINLKTGKKQKVLLDGMGTPNKEFVWEYPSIGVGPHNGADASVPSGMELPSTGKWQLDAYLGGKFFGSVVIEVRDHFINE
jgi:hypothetical protein